jgi:phosphoribosyl-dephospho-CoA transferase
MSTEGFRRHDLVWLDPDIDAAAYAVNAGDIEFVCHWVSHNWPLVVARQSVAASQSDLVARQAGQMQLGFTLPSAPARKRVALRVPQAAIISYSRPLKLKDAIAYAPQEWRPHLTLVVEICASHAVEARVYGSLSTQAFTGQTYLDAASDVDVLFECSKDTELQKLFIELHSLKKHKPHLDGEILATTGWAVSWRELAAALQAKAPVKLLAKSFCETRLLTLDQLFEQQLSAAA